MANIDVLMKLPRWPSASATHRQTGWGLHQCGWSNDTCATPQRRPRHELAWNWTDVLSEQRRAMGLVETAGGAARAGGKRQPARCSCKTQDKFAIPSMAKKLLHHCIGAHARAHVHFLRRVWCAFQTGVVSTMHVQVCTFDRCCEHQRTHHGICLHARYRMCMCTHVCAACLCSVWVTRIEGFSLVYTNTCCLA